MAESLQNELQPVSEIRNTPVTAFSLPNTTSAVSGTPTRVKSTQNTMAAVNQDALTNSAPPNPSTKGKMMPKPPDEFYRDLQQFHERRATPIMHKPKINGREVDLHQLYAEVTERGGFYKVNQRDEWDEILPELGIPEKCVNAIAALKYIYRRCLEKYEKQNFLGEDPDKLDAFDSVEALESGGRSRSRYPPTVYASTGINVAVNSVPMSYNYRQHIVNMDRRRTYKLSTDLHKGSPLEKLMLSLISPLPNEQDFAINVCSLMANENKHTLKLNEYPKILDMLLAHSGVFSDYTLRKLFHHVYTQAREHSLFAFWRDLLHDKPHILDLYTDEQAMRDAGAIDDIQNFVDIKKHEYFEDCNELDFLNLGRGEGTQEYIGQRVQQIVAILRNLSFFEENLPVLAKSRTFIRFIVMGANIRWANLHNQVLDIAGNIASEIELLDPSTDDVSRSLLATICDGVESLDRGVIINSLEILYKLCQKDINEEPINKCLSITFYETLCQFLCLNDIMLLIFTLEAIYALTSLGTRSCHLVMQVRGIIDQLVSLITVEAQSYGPDGCILMRVVETVPGNMLPMVAQNIANLQNATVTAKPTRQVFTAALQLPTPQPPLPVPVILPAQITPSAMSQTQTQVQPQLPKVPISQISTEVAKIQQDQTLQGDQPTTMTAESVSLVQQQQQQQHTVPTTTTTPQQSPNSIQTPKNTALEDEQYALGWLGATFERTAATESHIDQQELYRIYLTHCQKSGKHTFVNHVQFPKLVRLIFSNNAGPVTVRLNDGTSLPGLHYVGLRLRAQPLPIQPIRPKTPDSKLSSTSTSIESLSAAGRKLKKKPKIQLETPVTTTETLNQSLPSSTITTTANLEEPMEIDRTANEELITNSAAPMLIAQGATVATLALQQTVDTTGQPSSSLIKSMLANKVTQRQQKNHKELNTNVTSRAPSPQESVSTNITTTAPVNQPIKVPSTAISALVSNTLMQNTSLKVGQTTIKPLEKKPLLESTPPPLAPLSGNNVAKDSSGRPVIIANQILVDVLDNKGGEPPIPATIIKRKIEDSSEPAKRPTLEPLTSKLDDVQVTPSKNAANLYAEMAASILEDEDLEDIPPLPMTTAALSSSSTSTTQSINQTASNDSIQQQILIPANIQQAALQGVQRQIIFQSNQSPQIKLATHSGGMGQTTQLPTAMATIKTDQGLQTVPVILQQKTLEQSQQPQKLLQQVITQNMSQSVAQQQQTQPTQYVLATNHQGQTYLVAQQPQPPPPQQTVLVTQTPQQQSAGTKTIIILQQQPISGQQAQPQLITTGGQKMIMTTPQGQQVLVTQRPQPTLSAHPTTQQYFINPQTGTATPIQHIPVSSSGITTNVSSSNQILQRHQLMSTPQITTMAQTQPATAQISPSLLSQLNHIPATIKLHQPQMPPTSLQQQTVAHQHQPATISRLGKTVSIVQAAPGLAPPPPIQIPQLQQHQSIIQQHIISGHTDKRQVIIGGRAIEIKETVITQAPPATQQSQLNSQTIITKQILPAQQQQQQQTRTGSVEQQQQQYGPNMQQKILPKPADHPTLIQATLPVKNQTIVQTASQHQTTLTAQPVRTPTPQQQTMIGSEPPPLAQTASTSRQTIAAQQSQQVMQQQTEGSRNNESSSITSNTSTADPITSTSGVAATAISQPVTPPPLPSSPAPPQRPPSTPAAANCAASNTPPTPIQKQTLPIPQLPQVQLPPSATVANTSPQPLDPNWLFVCDWRNCPRRKYKSLNDLQHHACTLHCPDHLDASAEIFCQWGVGPGLCDGIPRKRYSLMTHIIDRHLSTESLRAAMQRRIATGTVNLQSTQSPVTIVRNVEAAQAQAQAQRNNTASPAPSTSSSSSSSTTGSQPPIGISNATGSSAMHAIKRHTADYVNPKELMDENEGPVTKSIRLTAALILRNLVTYNNTAKRNLRSYEPHLSNVALSNVESSVAIAHILYEINN
ncbi:AT-rich interactive domain-containing protein 2 [Eurosta solidaginis]|uniref:AT-rich interactive domain-containing protein 2 n=1 Tax=Eurosta solidaginis TaxID=178769 RepID=UPI003530778E